MQLNMEGANVAESFCVLSQESGYMHRLNKFFLKFTKIKKKEHGAFCQLAKQNISPFIMG